MAAEKSARGAQLVYVQHGTPEHLTTKGAAAYLGISPNTLNRYRWVGGGPRFLKPTKRRVIYRRQDLDDWLAGRAHTSTCERAEGAKP